MKRLLMVLVALLVAGSLSAGVTTILSSVSAASGTSGVIDTSGARTLNLWLCGTGFSGTVSIKQGPTDATVTETKAITFTTVTGCAESYALVPATKLEVTYTRSAGSLSAHLEYYQ